MFAGPADVESDDTCGFAKGVTAADELVEDDVAIVGLAGTPGATCADTGASTA